MRESDWPKEADALSSAALSAWILERWASISLPSTWLRAVRASASVAFFPNWEATTFISEPRTRISRLMSAIAFLNSRSPSRPIFKPKVLSDMACAFLGIQKSPTTTRGGA